MYRSALFLVIVAVITIVGAIAGAPAFLAPSPAAIVRAVSQNGAEIVENAVSTVSAVAGGNFAALLVALSARMSGLFAGSDAPVPSLPALLRRFPVIIFAPVPVLLLGVNLTAELVGAGVAALLAGLAGATGRDATSVDVATLAGWVRDTIAPTVAAAVVIEYLGAPGRGLGFLVIESFARFDAALLYGLVTILVIAVLVIEDLAETAMKQYG